MLKLDSSTGAIYVFVRDAAGMWTQQAFIKASHPGKEDWFGSRLALSGDGNTIAASAQLENGNSKGINGNEMDQSAEEIPAPCTCSPAPAPPEAGSLREGTNTDSLRRIRQRPGVESRWKNRSDRRARRSQPPPKAVNGNQNDNSAMGSAPVYIFTR